MIVDNPELSYFYHILYTGKKENVVGTQIERYYEDFRHVRLVPFSIIFDRLGTKRSAELFGDIVSEFQSYEEKPDYNQFFNTPEKGTVDYAYRWLIKMNWLMNDIKKQGCKEPVTGVIRPSFNNVGDIKYKIAFHPGTFRVHAFELMDLDQPCIVFDAFEVFHDYPKVSLSQILTLFNDPTGTKVEISLLQQDTSLNTPQILNMHAKGLNCSMTTNIKKWEKKNRHLFDKPIRIFIGYDSTHNDATNVCHNSILDKIPHEHRSNIKIQHLDVSKIKGWTREYKNQSTEFAYSRFLVPYLSDYEGISIFCDDDFIFTENILNLAYYISNDYAVSCVQHDFEHKFDTKFGDQKDVWYPKKLWSSLMVFNNSHPDCKKLTLESVQQMSGKELHQFEWTDNIGEIPKKWNWCEGYDSISSMHKSYGLHWTRGGPWIDGMDSRHIAGIEVYDAYRLRACTINPRCCSIIDMRNYYDLENAVDTLDDGSLICQEINRDVR
jgi:hypothetical protein